ncbi:hypothetical protein PENTCL1PPCAC_14171, partial [Pristionchus entomophagus]
DEREDAKYASAPSNIAPRPVDHSGRDSDDSSVCSHCSVYHLLRIRADHAQNHVHTLYRALSHANYKYGYPEEY